VTSSAAKPRQPERTPRKKPASKTASAATDRTKATIDWFAAHTQNRPKTQKRLISHLYTHFGKRLSNRELEAMVKELAARGAIEITPQGKVVYKV
jgi:hypothetical protein